MAAVAQGQDTINIARDYVPRKEYDALREAFDLAVSIAASRAEFERGEYFTNEEVMHEMLEKYAS